MRIKQFSQLNADEIISVLPKNVKTTNPIQGVYMDKKAIKPNARIGISTTTIPVGTVMSISVNPEDKSQLITNYTVGGNPVLTTTKQLVGNAEYVTNDSSVDDSKNVDNEDESTEGNEPKKNIFTPKNILIGLGVVVATVLVIKYVLKKS